MLFIFVTEERECVFAVNAIRSHSLFLMSKAYVLLCRKTGGGAGINIVSGNKKLYLYPHYL